MGPLPLLDQVSSRDRPASVQVRDGRAKPKVTFLELAPLVARCPALDLHPWLSCRDRLHPVARASAVAFDRSISPPTSGASIRPRATRYSARTASCGPPLPTSRRWFVSSRVVSPPRRGKGPTSPSPLLGQGERRETPRGGAEEALRQVRPRAPLPSAPGRGSTRPPTFSSRGVRAVGIVSRDPSSGATTSLGPSSRATSLGRASDLADTGSVRARGSAGSGRTAVQPGFDRRGSGGAESQDAESSLSVGTPATAGGSAPIDTT
jgi:hypothetical protein